MRKFQRDLKLLCWIWYITSKRVGNVFRWLFKTLTGRSSDTDEQFTRIEHDEFEDNKFEGDKAVLSVDDIMRIEKTEWNKKEKVHNRQKLYC